MKLREHQIYDDIATQDTYFATRNVIILPLPHVS